MENPEKSPSDEKFVEKEIDPKIEENSQEMVKENHHTQEVEKEENNKEFKETVEEKLKIQEIEKKEEVISVKPSVPVQRSFKKVGFVINPIAGKGRVLSMFQTSVLPKLKTKFYKHEICCYLTKKKGDGARLAQKYMRDGYDVIVSVGK